jgi:hypothetical protein
MSKKRREKMKAKAARHAKPSGRDKSAAHEGRPLRSDSQPAMRQLSTAAPSSHRERPSAGRKQSSAVTKSVLNPELAPHLKSMSAPWRNVYEQIARIARQ